jgi:MFS family permease
MPGVAGILLALSMAGSSGWSSPPVVGAFSAALLVMVLFVLRERSAAHPMVDLRLFASLRFRYGIAAGLLSYLVMFGVLFLIPFYLERDVAVGPAAAGLQLTVLPVALGIVAPFGGRIADRFGARSVTAGGMLVAALGLALLAIARGSTPLLLGELALIGAGLGAFTPANNATIMAAAPRSHSGVAGGVLNMTRGLGTSLGVALTGLVYTVVLDGSHLPRHAAIDRGVTAAAVFLTLCALSSAYLAARSRGED